jgi:hypothetical protein
MDFRDYPIFISLSNFIFGFQPNNEKDGKSLVISGKVSSLEGEFIPYANILVLGTVKGTYTNLMAHFRFMICPMVSTVSRYLP